jgi:hypothetical protein
MTKIGIVSSRHSNILKMIQMIEELRERGHEVEVSSIPYEIRGYDHDDILCDVTNFEKKPRRKGQRNGRGYYPWSRK